MYFKQFICRNIIYFAVCLIFSSQLAFATQPDRMCRRAQWPPGFLSAQRGLSEAGIVPKDVAFRQSVIAQYEIVVKPE